MSMRTRTLAPDGDGAARLARSASNRLPMLRVPVQNIDPGIILARPIPLPQVPRRYLLQRDREVPMDLVPRLKELGIYEVWVRCRDLEFLEDMIEEGLGDHQRDVYHQVRKNFEGVMRGAAAEMDIGRFQNSIGASFGFLKKSPSGSVLLQKLDALDNY